MRVLVPSRAINVLRDGKHGDIMGLLAHLGEEVLDDGRESVVKEDPDELLGRCSKALLGRRLVYEIHLRREMNQQPPTTHRVIGSQGLTSTGTNSSLRCFP